MFRTDTTERLPAAVLAAASHWDARHQAPHAQPEESLATTRNLTIAISRQLGALGEEVARAVGEELDWPVFDHEILTRIASEMEVRVELLESVDEHHQSWLLESIEALAPHARVSESCYLRHLVETICSLAAHGHCVVVGRGAAQFLPKPSTLRVRVIAPTAQRVERFKQTEDLAVGPAQRQLIAREKDRIAYVKGHFQADPSDPAGYDLILNTQQLSVSDCVELIVVALKLRSAPSTRPEQTSSDSD